MRDEVFIFIVFVLSASFMLSWHSVFDYTFGKSDVDNYLRFPYQQLTGLSLRHIIMKEIIGFFPRVFLSILIPYIFCYGILYPSLKLGYDVKIIFFGTALFQLMFIESLWSQFFSMACFLWAYYFFAKGNILGFPLLAAACLYFPFIYFLSMFLSLPLGLISLIIGYIVLPNEFTNTNILWNPLLSFVLFMCPLLFYRILKWDSEFGLKSVLLSFNRLSRGVMFCLPFYGSVKTKSTDMSFFIVWWLFILFFFLLEFFHEAGCVNMPLCERLHPYPWVFK